MATPKKTHKFAVRTKGLTNDQAAQLAYLISCAAFSFSDEAETASNVPVATLRSLFPDEDWVVGTAQERIALAK